MYAVGVCITKSTKYYKDRWFILSSFLVKLYARNGTFVRLYVLSRSFDDFHFCFFLFLLSYVFNLFKFIQFFAKKKHITKKINTLNLERAQLTTSEIVWWYIICTSSEYHFVYTHSGIRFFIVVFVFVCLSCERSFCVFFFS